MEHMHEHTHEHSHTHTHADGTTHTHEHSHTHSHEHAHEHDHEHMHGHDHGHGHEHDHIHEDGTVHTHSHEHHAAAPKEELIAMLHYMVGHNAAHIKETVDLAAQVREDHGAVYEKIAEAVKGFEAANAILADALKDLEG